MNPDKYDIGSFDLFDEDIPEYASDQVHNLFVYGSLKRGFHNHYLIEHTEFVGEAKTLDKRFIMFDLGGIPGVSGDNNYQISGEVFKIDGTTLAYCDKLESNGQLYQRELIQLDNSDEKAWMYILAIDLDRFHFGFDGVRQLQDENCLIWIGDMCESPDELAE